jgi:hypothetical protein
MKKLFLLLSIIIIKNLSAQNVGIGTTTPIGALNIFKADSSSIFFHNSATGSTISDGFFVGNQGISTGYIWNKENAPIRFGTNNIERLTITGDGNVGIGYNLPSYKLSVNGTIYSNGLYNTGISETNGTTYAYGSLSLSGKLVLQGVSSTVGNIVTTNSSGNAVWMPSVAFSVKDVGASSQSIAHNTDTRVNFDTEEYDLGNDFDLVNNIFTVPVTGIYNFSAGIMWDGPTNSTGILAITLRVNNTNYFTVRAPASASQTPSNMLSTDIKLTAGQTVTLLAYQNTGVAQNINSSNVTSRFTGRLVTLL